MYHFIYKTTSNSGKYYIGRHSTKDIQDGYFGSGKWIRSIKDRNILTREILEFCDEKNLKSAEKKYLEEHVGKENCMNFNLSAVGFSSGLLNPAHTDAEKLRRRNAALGDKNPSKRQEVRKKMSESQKGRPSPNKGKKMSEDFKLKVSNARKGIKYSEEGRKKLSESRKKAYVEGKRFVPSSLGIKHTEESKKLQSDKAKLRPKIKCLYCDMVATKPLLSRFHNDKCKNKSFIVACDKLGI